MDDAGFAAEVSRFLEAWMGARQLIQAANFNRFQSAGLSATQFMTLNLIPADEAGTTLSELAARLNLGVATLTRTIDSLEGRGLVERRRGERDRRQVLLTLTEEGKRFQNQASEEFHGHLAGLLRQMTPQQRQGLIQGLEGLLEAGGISRDGAPRAPRSSPRSAGR